MDLCLSADKNHFRVTFSCYSFVCGCASCPVSKTEKVFSLRIQQSNFYELVILPRQLCMPRSAPTDVERREEGLEGFVNCSLKMTIYSMYGRQNT